MKKWIKRSKSGQALVEYALVLALIAIVAILVIKAVGTKTASTFDNIQSQMTAQSVMSSTPVTPN
ncbi:MAG: Flp family type IVb pilin [Verrucomicrobia bacterium]|nr:Flp family type IVb pilin [Verrucomicrobiota bacterium]